MKQNPHIGSSFESWLDGKGIREEVTTAAIKAIIAHQLAAEMKKKHITKKRMAELMQTSRAQLDRILDLKMAAPPSRACNGRRGSSGGSCGWNWCE